MVEVARSGGIRLVGPNCNGIWSAAGQLNLSFSKAPKAGSIAFISQSGTFGVYMAQVASNKGYGLSKFISIGNQADLEALAALVKRKERVCYTAYNHRFEPHFIRLKETVEAGSWASYIELASFMETALPVTCAIHPGEIKEQGCVPATIAILNGKICVGLNSDQLTELVNIKHPIKVSVRDIALTIHSYKSGGTTVAGTLVIAQTVGIKVFTTGGIGGVHREAPFDISQPTQYHYYHNHHQWRCPHVRIDCP
jgi:hypothetical protein